MKIKSDFVTNSSSSSFVVIGSCIDLDSIPETTLKKIQGDEIELQSIMDNVDDYIYDYLKDTDLSYSRGSDYDSTEYTFGLEYTQMNDDETLAQFKERVRNLIKEKFDIDQKVSHNEDCWMDC